MTFCRFATASLCWMLVLSPQVFAADGGETDYNLDKDIARGSCKNAESHLEEAKGASCDIPRFRAAAAKRKELTGRARELGAGSLDSFPAALQRLEQESEGEAPTPEQIGKLEKARALEQERLFNNEEYLRVLRPACERAAVAYVKYCRASWKCSLDACDRSVTQDRQKLSDATKDYATASNNAESCYGSKIAGATFEESNKATAACEGMHKTNMDLSQKLNLHARRLQDSEENCKIEEKGSREFCRQARAYVRELRHAAVDEPIPAIARAEDEISEADESSASEINTKVSEIKTMRADAQDLSNQALQLANNASAYKGVAQTSFLSLPGDSPSPWVLDPPPGGGGAPLPPIRPAAAAAPASGGATGTPAANSRGASAGAETSSAPAANSGNETTAVASAAATGTSAGRPGGLASPTPVTPQTAVVTRTPSSTPAAGGVRPIPPFPAATPPANPAPSGARELPANPDAAPAATAAAMSDTGSDFVPAVRHSETAVAAGSPIGGVQMGRLGNGQTNNAAATPLGPNGTAMNSKTYSGYSSSSGGSARRYNGRPYIRRADGSLMTLEEYKDRIARGEKMPDVDLRQFLPGMNAPDRNVAGAAGVTAEDLATLGSKHENAFQMVNTRYNSLSNPLDPDLPPPK